MRKRATATAIALQPHTIPVSIGHRVDPVPVMTPAERELEQIRLAQHDPRAFAPLYDAYADMVWRFAMSRLGDHDRARDATSATFVKAIQGLARFRPKLQGEGTSFPAWLMMIARNTIIDDVRRHRPTTAIDQPGIESQLPANTTPESAALRNEERLRVRQAIAQLSPKQQRLVELRIAGYSGQEIADLMGMTVNGVRTAHSRAYSRLRELLAPDISKEDWS